MGEQQKLLSECLSERHSLAAERAKLTLDQKRVSNMEKREAQRRQEVSNTHTPTYTHCSAIDGGRVCSTAGHSDGGEGETDH